MKTKISVILTTYNVEKYIKESIMSLINQNFTDYEVIVLDDGSKDKTLEIVKKYSDNFDFIKLRSYENLKGGTLRDEGFKASKGEYIIFLDGVDIFHEDLLYKMYEKIKTEKADICICNSFEFLGNKKNILKRHFHKTLPYGWAWDKLIKRSLIEKNKEVFSSLKSANNILFASLSCFLAQKIVKIDDCLVYRRIMDDSLTLNRNDENVFEALLELKENLEKQGIYEKLEKDFKLVAMQSIVHYYGMIKEKNKRFLIFKAIKEYEKDFHILALGNVIKEYTKDFEIYKRAVLVNSFLSFRIQLKLFGLKKENDIV